MWLKQSTAYTFRLGPFVDSGDGVTAETTLTLTQADFRLSKAGGAFAQKNETTAGAHDENGYYTCILNATDTNTLGTLDINVSEAGALPVFRSFMVVPAMIYDSLVAGTDRLDTNVTHAVDVAWASGAITAAVIATDAIDADAIAANAIDAGAIATGAITAAKFAAGAIDAAAIAADAIGASELATDAVTEIATAVWATATRSLTILDEDSTTLDLDATIRAAVGLAAANLDTQIGDLPTNAELATSQASADDATLAAIAALNNLSAAQVNAEVDTAIADAALATAANLAVVAGYLDTEIAAIITAVADLPTNAELATALAAADDAVLTAIGDLPTNAELATALSGFSTQASVDAVATQVEEVWQIHGLDIANPMTVTPTSRDAGTIAQTISGDGVTTTTVTRT